MRQAIAPNDGPGPTSPWWLEEAGLPAVPSAPPLSGEAAVDVAVLGGGYTGLSTTTRPPASAG